MSRWKQRASGDYSPVVGRDYNHFEGMSFEHLLKAIRTRDDNIQELELEVDQLKRFNRAKIQGIVVLTILCMLFFNWVIFEIRDAPASQTAKPTTATSQTGNSTSHIATPSTETSQDGNPSSTTISEPVSLSTASADSNPRAASLPCTQGKWVTVLGGWKPAGEKANARDVFETLQEVQARSQSKGVELRVNYTWLDKDQCGTLKKGLYVLWSGPYPNSSAAIDVCNRLGWKTRADDSKCYGRTIDQKYSGKSHIPPDGGQ